MKIVLLNTVYKYGGSTGRIVYDLAQTIEQAGDSAYVGFGYGYRKTNNANTFRMENQFEIKWNILKTRLLAEHGFYNRAQTKRLLNWLTIIKPDIIHLHNIHNHYVNVEMLFDYIKEHNIPVVWTLHDCWSFTGWCAYFDRVDCDRWKSGCGHCPNKHEYPFSWFFDRSESNYIRKKKCFQGVKNLTIVTPCKWLENLVRQSYLQQYRTVVINNGIDTNVFKPTKSDIREKYHIGDRRMILAVSIGAPKRKGTAYIFKLAEDINTKKEIIVMVGLSRKQICKLPDSIIGVERTENLTELAEFYSEADVFINPTLEDNFPTTNLEALACGTPVVTFQTGGSPESIDDKTGAVVAKGNYVELYKAVNKIISGVQVINSSDCIERAIERYDKYKCFSHYLDLYRSIQLTLREDNK